MTNLTGRSALSRLDPRTVSPAVLVERLGARRPAISIAVLAPGGCLLSMWLDPSADCLPATLRPGLPEETPTALLARLMPTCFARLLVVASVPPEPQAVLELYRAFERDPQLGAIATGPLLFAIRGDIWTAFRGLDTEMQTLDQAFDDLFGKIRALGFAFHEAMPAPVMSRPAVRARGRTLQAAVYTAITRGYDTLKPQPQDFVGAARQVAFLDRETAALHEGHARGWQIEERIVPIDEPRRASRYYKANAHRAFPDAEFSLWIDASIAIVAPMSLARLAEIFLADCDICVFGHHARRSIAEEAAACKTLGLDDAATIDRQLERYRLQGMPPAMGLAELPVILRRHTAAVRDFNEAWWAEIVSGSHRDQLSFDYNSWKSGIRYGRFPLSLAVRNGLFVKYQRLALPALASQGESAPERNGE